jgi:hypothetical protein
MPSGTGQIRHFADRQSMALRGVHRNENGHFSLTDTGQIESVLIDSEIRCEDCGNEVRVFLADDAELQSLALSKTSFRLIRASTLLSPFAPDSGFRVDGEYRNSFRNLHVLDDNNNSVRAIVLESVDAPDLPLREPFKSIVCLVERWHCTWRVEIIQGAPELLVFSSYRVVMHVRPESKGAMEVYLYF